METMPELFSKFGGHKQAAGLTMSAGKVVEFRERLNSFAKSCLTAEDLCATVEPDGEITFADLIDESAAEVLELAPFGFGNPSPLFAIRDVEIPAPPEPLAGEKGLWIRLKQNGRTMRIKAWGMAPRASEFTPGARMDVALAIEDDPYSAARGYQPWCVTLKDARPATPAAQTK